MNELTKLSYLAESYGMSNKIIAGIVAVELILASTFCLGMYHYVKPKFDADQKAKIMQPVSTDLEKRLVREVEL